MLSPVQFHELRLASGASIYTLGESAGVSWITVLNAESGRVTIKPETRRRLEAALDQALEERAVLVNAARYVLATAQ